jgi:ribosomal protein S18 acetylase RimI-like enzyme
MDRMRMPLDQPPAQTVDPQGIQIRAVQDEKDFDNFLFVLWESFEDHWGHIPEPYEDFDRRAKSYIRKDPGMADSLCLLALEGGQPAGASLCRRDANGEAELGWINMLGVRRDWRKRGLGKALLLHSFALFKSIGMCQVGLDVDSESLTGALRLYESVGLRTVRSSVTYQKELRPGKDLTVQNLHDTTSQE